jgi:hypothetical protein
MHRIKAPQFQHVRALSYWVWPVHRYKAHSFTFYCHWEYLKIATSCSWRNFIPLHKNLKVPLYKVPGYMLLSNMFKYVCLLESKTSLHHIRHLHKTSVWTWKLRTLLFVGAGARHCHLYMGWQHEMLNILICCKMTKSSKYFLHNSL